MIFPMGWHYLMEYMHLCYATFKSDLQMFVTTHVQGATLMVALLPGASWISIWASRFCQLLAWWASSFSGLDVWYSVYYTICDGQVNQLSGHVQFWYKLPGGQVLKNPNVMPWPPRTQSIHQSHPVAQWNLTRKTPLERPPCLERPFLNL